jgi:hypothetical protein
VLVLVLVLSMGRMLQAAQLLRQKQPQRVPHLMTPLQQGRCLWISATTRPAVQHMVAPAAR